MMRILKSELFFNVMLILSLPLLVVFGLWLGWAAMEVLPVPPLNKPSSQTIYYEPKIVK